VHANIVGASALLSTSLPAQREIVQAFTASGSRGNVKLVFGGAPATEQWVREIGGDGYAEDAAEAVKLTRRLLGLETQVP